MIWPFGSRGTAAELRTVCEKVEQLERQLDQLAAAAKLQSTDLAAMMALLERSQSEQNSSRKQEYQMWGAIAEQLRGQAEQFDDLLELSARQQGDSQLLSSSIRAHMVIADDIQRALRHSRNSGGGPWDPVFRQWQQLLENVLGQMGVESLDVTGQPFDPRIAEAQGVISPQEAAALDEARAAEPAPFTVVETLRRGYRWRGTLLQKALVVTVGEEKTVEQKSRQE